MKTLILSFILIFGLAASNHGKPINDIYSLQDPDITGEAYINDIPFDTWEIAVEAIFDGDKVKLEEESYISDIPFDTRAVVSKYLLGRMLETSGEANVNDIPFSTAQILNTLMADRLTEQYRDEKSVYDLPATRSNFVYCSYEKYNTSFSAIKVNEPKKVSFSHRRITHNDCTNFDPVKIDIQKVEVGNPVNHEVLIVPGFSL